jgi:prevent-host-death family protein
VGVRELKAHLSEYLARARAGEIIIVTDRGEKVAQLTAPAPSDEDTVWAMVRAGEAEWSGKRLTHRTPVAKVRAGTSVSDLIIQERDEAAARFEKNE